MIIHPEGLFAGERLAQCSDEAQLHFPRLVGLCNAYGRMQLSASLIIDTAYANFRVKPSREQLTGWLREYHEHYLLYVYRDNNGATWGQWAGMPESALPRHKNAESRRSPAPDPDDFLAYESAYDRLKQERLKSSGDFISLSEDFGNVPKCAEGLRTLPPVSEDVGAFPLGIGVGVGVGEGVGGGKDSFSSPSAPDSPDSPPVEDTKDSQRRAAIRRVFSYYLKETGRNPKTYVLTDTRMNRALKCLRECEKRVGAGPPAEEALGAAVDGLLRSDWHMGRDPKTNGKKYTEWEEHIFRNVETMERRWSDGGFEPDVHAGTDS